jgi:uncharacterized protein
MTGRRILAGAALLLLLLYPILRGPLLIENSFFYPDRVVLVQPAQLGLASEDVALDAEDGSRLAGWWLPAAGEFAGRARATVLHLHGNAGNVGTHLQQVAWMPAAGFNVLMFDYRSYGRSTGAPRLDGLVQDGLAALRYLRTRPGVDRNRLIVLGQSLGGASALRMLAQDHAGVKLAVIDAAFSSYRGIAHDAVRFNTLMAMLLPLGLPMLPPVERDPVAAISAIGVPLLLVHGTDDLVVPYHHAEALYAAAREPKRLIRAERGQHVESLLLPEVRKDVLAAMCAAAEAE